MRQQSPFIEFPLDKKLLETLDHLGFTHLTEIQEKAKAMIQGILEVEYLEIRDAETLKNITSWENNNGVFVSFAGMIDGVRLIDNIRF